MTTAEAAPRERGWRRLLPALAVFLFVPAIPQLRLIVPIEQTLLVLAPILAIAGWLGWREGGRLWWALTWSAIAIWVLSRPMAGGAEYVAFARGWALVLAGSFGVTSLMAPARSFFIRSVSTVGIAALIGGVVLGISGSKPRQLSRVIGAEIADRVDLSVAALRERTTTPEWQAVERDNPDGAAAVRQMVDGIDEQLRALAPAGSLLFPALLAFETLAALALAWSLFHRLSRARIGPPLQRLREFRFDDQLIWGVIVGLVFVLVPGLSEAREFGINVLVFFGALYAVRGLGVMSWFLVSPGRLFGSMVMIAVALIPVLWSIPLGLGLGDTWIDWRRRVRPATPGSTQ